MMEDATKDIEKQRQNADKTIQGKLEANIKKEIRRRY